MLRFYYNLGPNPLKVALFLEETGIPYEPIPVDGLKGEQFSPSFLAINPNGKVPAIVDGDCTVFDSNAILLYLAEKTGQLLSSGSAADRGELLSWLMFIATGLGPYAGQAVHFTRYAPAGNDYARTRYLFEAERHFNVMNSHLENQQYVVGNDYSVADIALWGWARAAAFVLGEDKANGLTHVNRLVQEINARPAAARVEALRSRHTFESDFNAQAKRFLFKHIVD